MAGGARQGDTEGGAPVELAFHVDPAVVGVHELGHYRQPDAGSARLPRAGLLASPEAREDVAQVFGSDTDARVGHFEHGRLGFLADAERYPFAARRVAKCVLEQIRDDLVYTS